MSTRTMKVSKAKVSATQNAPMPINAASPVAPIQRIVNVATIRMISDPVKQLT
jgi:hypothetical protein